jgi:hypothetical protein
VKVSLPRKILQNEGRDSRLYEIERIVKEKFSTLIISVVECQGSSTGLLEKYISIKRSVNCYYTLSGPVSNLKHVLYVFSNVLSHGVLSIVSEIELLQAVVNMDDPARYFCHGLFIIRPTKKHKI